MKRLIARLAALVRPAPRLPVILDKAPPPLAHPERLAHAGAIKAGPRRFGE